MLLDARAGTETGKLASKRNGAPEPGRKCWNQSEEKMPPNEEASGKTVGDGGSLCRGVLLQGHPAQGPGLLRLHLQPAQDRCSLSRDDTIN